MMKTMQNNNDIRKRLDFSNDDKPKRQTTNIHMFLNQHQNKPKNFQSEPNMLNKNVTFTSQQDNTSNINNSMTSVSFNSNNTIPTKNLLPMPSTSEGNMNTSTTTEQKYAGGGYSKSPNPKSLGKPGLQSPLRSNSPPKREYILNHNNSTSVPFMINTNTSPVQNTNTSQQSNVLRFDSETFFKSVNTSNNNLLNPPFFNIHSNMK